MSLKGSIAGSNLVTWLSSSLAAADMAPCAASTSSAAWPSVLAAAAASAAVGPLEGLPAGGGEAAADVACVLCCRSASAMGWAICCNCDWRLASGPSFSGVCACGGLGALLHGLVVEIRLPLRRVAQVLDQREEQPAQFLERFQGIIHGGLCLGPPRIARRSFGGRLSGRRAWLRLALRRISRGLLWAGSGIGAGRAICRSRARRPVRPVSRRAVAPPPSHRAVAVTDPGRIRPAPTTAWPVGIARAVPAAPGLVLAAPVRWMRPPAPWESGVAVTVAAVRFRNPAGDPVE